MVPLLRWVVLKGALTMVQGSLTISSCGPRKREQSKGQGRVLGFAFVWMREGGHVGRWFAGLVSTVCVCVRLCAL